MCCSELTAAARHIAASLSNLSVCCTHRLWRSAIFTLASPPTKWRPNLNLRVSRSQVESVFNSNNSVPAVQTALERPQPAPARRYQCAHTRCIAALQLVIPRVPL